MSKKYDFGFTFVRNPFERIVSFYINKFIDCNKEILGGKPGFLYENYLCNCFNQNMSFIDVVEIISDIPDHVSEKHFRSQSYDVALLTRSVNTVFIGRLENLKNDLEIVYQTTGEFIVGHINKSSRYNYMDYYDLKSLNVIYERYKSDVIDFGYEEEYVRIKRYIEGRDL